MAQKTRSGLLLKIVSLVLLALAIYAIVVTIIGFVKLNSFEAIGAGIASNVVRLIVIAVAFFAGWFGFTARRKALCYLLAIVMLILAAYCFIIDIIGSTSISGVIASLISDILFILLPILYFIGLKKSA